MNEQLRGAGSFRILHVITGTGTGGAERMMLHVCKQLQATGIESTVVSLQPEGAIAPELRSAGAEVLSLRLARGRLPFGALRDLRNMIDACAPAIVQGWMYHGNLAATLAVAGRKPRPVLAWNVRQSLYDLGAEPRLTRWVIRAGAILSRQPAAIVYNSDVSRRQHESLGFAAARACTIDNGFDTDVLRPDPVAAAKFREAWQVPPGALLFGCMARWHPIKNHAGLIDAFARVYARHPSVRLVLVGEGLDQTNPDLVAALRRQGGAAAGVVLAGPVVDVAGAMSAMDIVCLASHAEGFPNVVGEAMACQRPCIVTDVGDAPRIVGDGGWVVPRADTAALATAMQAALALDPRTRALMGENARRRIQERFAIGRIGTAYAELYRRLLSLEPA